MYDPHDPRFAERERLAPYRERAFRRWCADRLLDPEDTASAVAYEIWQAAALDPEVVAVHWPELAS